VRLNDGLAFLHHEELLSDEMSVRPAHLNRQAELSGRYSEHAKGSTAEKGGQCRLSGAP